MTNPQARTDALPPIDYEAFARDLSALRAEVDASLGPEDLEHLRKIERWGRWCTGLGYGTAWLGPNLVSAALISLGNTARWTTLMHHVGHRGYDRVPGVPERYTSKRFAVGARRYVDWLDWILPEAWCHEHNVLHHYHTGEIDDPDLVEENVKAVREAPIPRAAKYAVAAFYACTWKLTYYAPNTFQVLARKRRQRAAASGAPLESRDDEERYAAAFNPLTPGGRAFLGACVLPYAAARFAVAPALFAPLGPWAVLSVLGNSLAAEVLTNIHTFVIIGPNHAGEDLYRFEGRVSDKAEFFVRQAAGSVNYRTGGDVNDFLHGWLNYQIEHHLFPDLPMLRYQQIQPRVRAICEAHGVPYVQEGVLRRAKKMLDLMVGKTSMRRAATLSKRAREQAASGVAEAAE
jgi:fatty acid desaturase